MNSGGNSLSAEEAAKTVLSRLRESGIIFIACLPDINRAQLFVSIDKDQSIPHIPLRAGVDLGKKGMCSHHAEWRIF